MRTGVLLPTRHVSRQKLVVKSVLKMADALRVRMLAVTRRLRRLCRLDRAAAQTNTAAKDAYVAIVMRGVIALDWSRSNRRLGRRSDRRLYRSLDEASTEHVRLCKVKAQHRMAGIDSDIARTLFRIVVFVAKETNTGKALSGISNRGVVDRVAVVVGARGALA